MFATAYAQRETVELAGEIYDFDEIARYMDAELFYKAAEWAGPGATRQGVLDEYLRLHEKRHGAPFAVPPRR